MRALKENWGYLLLLAVPMLIAWCHGLLAWFLLSLVMIAAGYAGAYLCGLRSGAHQGIQIELGIPALASVGIMATGIFMGAGILVVSTLYFLAS